MTHRLLRAALCLLGALLPALAPNAQGVDASEARANYFDDPFVQVTHGISACPVPAGPSITKAEMLAQSHYRADRGVNCFLAGRCRLPNSYLYDQDIIARVRKAIDFNAQFADSSVWAEGQRRWVWLKGCVRRAEDAQALERLVQGLDDVEAVVNELAVLAH